MKSERTWSDPVLYLAILINIAVYHVWFTNTGILTHGDMFYKFTEQLSQVTTFQTWSSMGLGGITGIPSAYSYSLLSGLLAKAGFSYALISRVIFFWPLVIVGSLGSYLLVKKLSGSRVGGLLGSIIFSLNTFFIVSSSAYAPIATAIAWFPLTLYLFVLFSEKPSIWMALACSLPLFIISCLEFRIFYVCLLPLLLFYFFSLHEGLRRKRLPEYTFLFFLPVAVTILLNSYWLVPYYLGGLEKGLQGIIVGRDLFTGGIGPTTNLLHNAYAIFHPIWSGGELVLFSVHPIPIYWFLIPLLAFSTLLFNKLRQDGRVLFFALVALFGIFLTKFYFPPFSGAYQWLYDHFPGFNAFREPGKFTFLIYLPYAVLIGCLVGHLLQRAGRRGWKPAAVLILTALIALPFLVNAIPVATQSAGTIFVRREIPKDYVVLRDFILDQPEFFRTLWVPTYSRWAYRDESHPFVSCVDALAGGWSNLQERGFEDLTIPENIVAILEQSFSLELLSSSSIKYVIVPLQDARNDDDFFIHYGGDREFFVEQLDGLEYLERIDIGTEDLAVYVNGAYDPAVFAAHGICRLDPEGDIDAQYSLASSLRGGDLPFTTDEVPFAAIDVEDLLAGAAAPGGSSGDAGVETAPADTGETLSLYADRSRGELRCSLAGGTATFWRVDPGALFLNGQPLPGAAGGREVLCTMQVGPEDDCWLEADGAWIYLGRDEEVSLGRIDRISTLLLYRVPPGNLIPNGSFEEGLWTEEVLDCYAYDERPQLDMSLSGEESTAGRYALQLEATRHIAGTYTDFPVEGNRDYSLSFDYQSPNGAEAGYYLEFDDDAKTAASARWLTVSEAWRRYQHRVTVPRGASTATLYLYSYESDGATAMVTRYDDVELEAIDFAGCPDLAVYGDRFVPLPLETRGGSLAFEFKPAAASGVNIVPNGSFEEGLWTEEVLDGYAYDERPQLDMSLSGEESTAGRYALQLEATRHIARTFVDFPVEGGGDYYLSFDYQSPNGAEAGYLLEFDDGAGTSTGGRLPAAGTSWQHLQQRVEVPLGATSAVLSLFCYESDGRTNNIARYDHVEFSRVSEGPGLYYLVRTADGGFAGSTSVEVTDSRPTEKTVQVGSSSDPFVLVMSQQYDEGWRLRAGKDGKNASLEGRISNVVGARGEDEGGQGVHFSIDGGVNAWYVLPGEPPSASTDGGGADAPLDFTLVMEFYPQRQAKWGSLITLLTFLAVLVLALAGLALKLRAQVRKGRSGWDTR
ncbi:MAG: hypothetical protein C4536_11990 [Actinobacteria bacterium]|jgi:phage terminase large subunit-like protein|nr:MAG: hypothetical protein C4536_11990 [Actinomycetota bacterium]